jgi:hypothetical protein
MQDPRVFTKEITKEASLVSKDRNFEPRFSSVYADAGVFCPALMANFHIGGMVLVNDRCGMVTVGRVLDIVTHYKVAIKWCPMMDYSRFKRPPLR